MDMLTTTIVYIDAIDHELEKMKYQRPDYYIACDKNCAVCGVKLCCHFEGQACSESKNNVAFDKELIHNYGLSPEPAENNQLTDKEKSQLLSIFQKYNIKKITWENDKLVIEYNNSETKSADKQELEKYKQFIQNQPNHSISLNELQNNTASNPVQSNPNKNNHQLVIYLTLGAGAIILGGIVVYFLSRKKKVK